MVAVIPAAASGEWNVIGRTQSNLARKLLDSNPRNPYHLTMTDPEHYINDGCEQRAHGLAALASLAEGIRRRDRAAYIVLQEFPYEGYHPTEDPLIVYADRDTAEAAARLLNGTRPERSGEVFEVEISPEVIERIRANFCPSG